jgi:uncharacterized Ntn-hydrolase superfamily protein
MTYSIVARDPETGELGVAVQSRHFRVGPTVAWAEPGVGAVATQAFTDPGYGPNGLVALRAGTPPETALAQLLAADAERELRQVAVIDAQGRAAVHTGSSCIEAAGHLIGDGFAAQANMVRSARVWEAMGSAYAAAAGGLAERMLAALDAAEAAGGDVRGRQSAALLVVAGQRRDAASSSNLVDVRVDDHREPLLELRRLFALDRSSSLVTIAQQAAAAGRLEDALRSLEGARSWTPDDPQLDFWTALVHANLGSIDEAHACLRRATDAEPGWRDLLSRLAQGDRIPRFSELLDRLDAAE